ncbi:MAG: flagellar basal body P-ring formation chaperone FlgA [Gammaproteobacteria bacterium]|nr:flagellar basal body P-ring formation chaperone FlgA [Gammaproteobacteria bacterium]MDH5728914.1 flagellar basal body P-ring formation chaperone FlgA [Gammaproteobacteria bacterium]
MKYFVVVMVLSSISSLVQSQSMSNTTLVLTLKPALSTQQTWVDLQSISQGALTPQLNRYASTPLFKLPRLEQTVVYDRAQIQARLANIMGRDRKRLRIQGSKQITVSRDTKFIAKQTYLAKANKALDHYFSSLAIDQLQITHTPSGRYTNIVIPTNVNPQIDCEAMPASRIVQVNAQCRISINGTLYHRIIVHYTIEAQALGFQTTRAYTSGQTMQPHNLIPVTIDLTKTNGQPIQRLEQLSEFITARALSSGAIVTEHDLKRMPAVQAGQSVSVRSQSGNVTIEIKAIALSDGEIGDEIRVQNTTSQKIFSVRVRGQNYASTH